MTLAGRIDAVREKIAEAARRAGRDPAEVQLVAVTKTVPAEVIAEAYAAGLRIFGENRVQEAAAKIPKVPGPTWHLIGHLQRNKARKAVGLFSMIQSLDSLRLAETLDRLGRERGRPVETLVEVNLAAEPTKSGVSPRELPGLLDRLERAEGIRVRGLMAVPPFEEDPEASRSWFRALRRLAEAERPRRGGPIELVHLSMGMSHDFEVAIEEGATIVRVGTAIFGPRPSP
ncbi:MAG: YggS family pyridoxal phosphate-dependent enzyme [Acidobacteria bacterium]|nr:MAG: YggS family pyridoxal phosphate-dependent enzyme [Acidobacteriota bacterium]